jgi:putative MFS transporter
MFISGVIPAIVVLLFRRTIPESPRWLLETGRYKEATDSIASIEHNIAESKVNSASPASEDRNNHINKFIKILQPPLLRFTLILAVMWFLLNSMSSSFAIYYPTILHAFGMVSKSVSLMFSASLFLVDMIAALVAALYIDRLGRRRTMYIVLAVSLLGALMVISQHGRAINPTVLAIGVMLGSAGLLTSSTAIMNLSVELFPTSVRATAGGFAMGSNKLGAYVGTLAVPTILHIFGIQGMMFVLMLITIIAIILTSLLHIEPAQRSLEEITIT